MNNGQSKTTGMNFAKPLTILLLSVNLILASCKGKKDDGLPFPESFSKELQENNEYCRYL